MKILERFIHYSCLFNFFTLLHNVKLVCSLVFMMLSGLLAAQNNTVSGTVIDSATQLPVAFAAISIKETKKGSLTDIDGRFSLQNVPPGATLIISYTGYVTKRFILEKNNAAIHISISRKNESLEEVMVTSGINPAHRIILLMQQNRKRNDPFNISSYFYNAYTIAAAGIGQRFLSIVRQLEDKSLKKAAQKKPKKVKKPVDSVELKTMLGFRHSLIQNYMFVAESYTEKKYLYPGKFKETVLATKVSGFDNPIFTVTQAAFQKIFGFYQDFIPMGSQTFTSPVISGSIDLYKFNLREMIPHGNDTTWVISFEPKKGKNFTGLKGMLYIHSDGYAIENVIASPADEKDMLISFRLQQKYERVQGKWFPRQLNTSLFQKELGKDKDSVLYYWDARTYINNIAIDQPFRTSEFSDIMLEIPRDVGTKTEAQWQQFRTDSLPAKEKATYQAYASLPEKKRKRLNRINNLMETVSLQAFTWGQIDFPFRYLLVVNGYEKSRLGFGIATNDLFSKRIGIGGYAGFGLGDRSLKYGGNLALHLNRRTHTELRFLFQQDLQEVGTIPFFRENGTLYSNNVLRSLFGSRFDSIRLFKIGFNTKLTTNIQVNAWWLKEHRSSANYVYGFDADNRNLFGEAYRNVELGIGIRYSRKESYARLGRAIFMNAPPDTRILFQLSQGLNNAMGGDVHYTKMALQVNQFFDTKLLGRTSYQAEFGKIWGNAPYAYLFNTRGSIAATQKQSSLYIPNSFQTAGVYEFQSTQSASLFLQQNFGNLLFKSSNAKFRPEIAIAQHIGYGSIGNPLSHSDMSIQAPEKGLFESGLMVNNLYRFNLRFFYLGFGLGYFQRYGYYAFPEQSRNRSIKFWLDVSF